MISDLLFVYGTLMRGFDHPMAQLLSRTADYLSPARCQGRLYLVKHYPGLVLSDDRADVVFGDLFRLRSASELLRELDRYEACGEGLPEPTEYLRQMLTVTSDDGAVSEAWTYIYNWPVAHLPRIASGRFLDNKLPLRIPSEEILRQGQAGPERLPSFQQAGPCQTVDSQRPF